MAQHAVDFLPEDYVEKRQATRSAILCIGLCVVVMAGIVTTYLMTQRNINSALHEYEEVTRQFNDASKLLADMQEVDNERSRMLQKAEVTAMLQERVPRSRLLEEFTRLSHGQAKLLTIELKSREIAVYRPTTELEKTKKQMAGKVPEIVKPPELEVNIELTGVAPTDGHLAQFISALGKSPILTDVNLVYTEEFKIKERMMRKFRLDMRLNRDVNLGEMASAVPADKQVQ